MLIYAVTNNIKPVLDNILALNPKSLTPFKNNILISYYYLQKGCTNKLKDVEKLSNNILIDSGAFSLLNNKTEVSPNDLFNYLQEYKKFIKKYDNDLINGYFELDVGKIIGYSHVKQFREELFNISDKIIPVWHAYLGVDEFIRMCGTYNYIAIGGIVHEEILPKQLAPFVKYGLKHDVKIHGLGISNERWLDKLPFYSVDSTAYLRLKYGRRARFKQKQDITYIKKKSLKQKSDAYRLNEWIFSIKYNNYWSNYWKTHLNKFK